MTTWKLLLPIIPAGVVFGIAGYLEITWLCIAMLAIPVVLSIVWLILIIRAVKKNRSEETGEVK